MLTPIAMLLLAKVIPSQGSEAPYCPGQAQKGSKGQKEKRLAPGQPTLAFAMGPSLYFMCVPKFNLCSKVREAPAIIIILIFYPRGESEAQ